MGRLCLGSEVVLNGLTGLGLRLYHVLGVDLF